VVGTPADTGAPTAVVDTPAATGAPTVVGGNVAAGGTPATTPVAGTTAAPIGGGFAAIAAVILALAISLDWSLNLAIELSLSAPVDFIASCSRVFNLAFCSL
jgi:hypothetical protein